MKRMKWIVLLVLALWLLAGPMPETVSAAEVIDSGTCGEDLTWTLRDDGVLTISGQGEMTGDDSPNSAGSWRAPWYAYKARINTIVVEEGVTSIGEEAFFYYYENVTTVSLPDTLVSIEDHAFYHCTGLTEIIIPDSVRHIGNTAFGHCDALTAVDIPGSVTDLEKYAFYSCDSLVSVRMTDSIGALEGCVFNDCNALRSIVIPEGITAVGDCVFGTCDLLETVILPDTVATLGDFLFSYCKNLKTITIPASVTSIDAYTFECCDSLEQVVFLGDAPVLGAQLFHETATTVYYPAGNPTWTADVMHSYGGSVTWVPYDGTVEIASGWSGDTRWTLTHDGVLTFRGSGRMKNYDWDGGQPWAAYADLITGVVVEAGVTAVGSGAFMDLSRLEQVTLPESGLETIGEAAFYGCDALRQIRIPEGVYTIWAYTFKNCASLEAVELPETLIKIDQGAFENCTALERVRLPGDTGIIGAWSFKGCTALREADMQAAAATGIREGAFKNCAALTTIHLPADLRTLGESCFYGIGAAGFTVPGTVTDIGGWCFARAYAMEEIVFEGDAPAIGEGAFNQITLTAKYPAGNATWTAEAMDNYGGTVTWMAN